MTTHCGPAHALRRSIADVYLADPPPPGADRASWLTTALARAPDDPVCREMARDLLAVVTLHRRLAAALTAAEARGDRAAAAALAALLDDAAAELDGGTRAVGWRAEALDLLDPDEHAEPPLAEADAVRLFALALGLPTDEPAPSDAPD